MSTGYHSLSLNSIFSMHKWYGNNHIILIFLVNYLFMIKQNRQSILEIHHYPNHSTNPLPLSTSATFMSPWSLCSHIWGFHWYHWHFLNCILSLFAFSILYEFLVDMDAFVWMWLFIQSSSLILVKAWWKIPKDKSTQ